MQTDTRSAQDFHSHESIYEPLKVTIMEVDVFVSAFITIMFAVWIIGSAYKYNDIEESPEEYR